VSVPSSTEEATSVTLLSTYRSSMVDVEPVHTYRGHRGSVLSVAVGASGDICFSGSTDTTIRVWQLPSDLGDPFDVYGKIIWFFMSCVLLLLTSTHTCTHRPRGSSRSSSGTHRCNMGSCGPLQWPAAVLWGRWNMPAMEPSAHEPTSATLPC